MGKKLKGSQTEVNLLTAFAGESQARNRYDYFGGQAKKDGFVEVQHIFFETALQEKAHAKRLFKFLEGGEVTISAAFPAGVIATTEANLIASAHGEHHEYTEMYPSFANIADQEGFTEIACTFRSIAIAEEYHEKRFLNFAKNIKEGRIFVQEQKTKWRCLNCGFIMEGTKAPHACAACDHPQEYFEVLKASY